MGSYSWGIVFSVVWIFIFIFYQLLPGMWRGNRGFFLRLRFCVLGCSERVVLRHAEGSARSWTPSAPWLWHQNTERRRGGKRWYRDVSRRNASTAWRTIDIFCKIFSFFWRCNFIHNFFRFPLALSTGHQFQSTLTNWLKPWLKREHHLYVNCSFSHNNLWFKHVTESDSCLSVPRWHIIGANGRKNQIIRSRNDK